MLVAPRGPPTLDSSQCEHHLRGCRATNPARAWPGMAQLRSPSGNPFASIGCFFLVDRSRPRSQSHVQRRDSSSCMRNCAGRDPWSFQSLPRDRRRKLCRLAGKPRRPRGAWLSACRGLPRWTFCERRSQAMDEVAHVPGHDGIDHGVGSSYKSLLDFAPAPAQSLSRAASPSIIHRAICPALGRLPAGAPACHVRIDVVGGEARLPSIGNAMLSATVSESKSAPD